MDSGADLLRTAILERGRVEGPLLKVDDFLNHRIEPSLMRAIGQSVAERFADDDIDLVLTAEASGIPPALEAAAALGVDCVYAKKYPRHGPERPSHVREVSSPTKGVEYRVEVAHRVLPAGSSVLIVDDFLARGRTAEALGEITEQAGSTVTGLAFVIEKGFMDGRNRLESHGWRVDALVTVTSLDDQTISLA